MAGFVSKPQRHGYKYFYGRKMVRNGRSHGSVLNAPNVFFRYLAGWIDLTDITHAPPGERFSLESNGRTAYVYRRNDRESYFIEARIRDGRGKYLPGSGLAIWHVHTDGSNFRSDKGFPRVRLIQADGENHIYRRMNTGDATDLFRLGLNAEFNNSTRPAAVWHDQTPSYINIADISDTGAGSTLAVNGGEISGNTAGGNGSGVRRTGAGLST